MVAPQTVNLVAFGSLGVQDRADIKSAVLNACHWHAAPLPAHYRLVVQMESMAVSKTADSGSYPDRPVIADWFNGRTPDSDSGDGGS